MKKTSLVFAFLFACFISSITQSCKQEKEIENSNLAALLEAKTLPDKNPLSNEFKEYWYSGEAEINSYKLEQARYGEMREGTAILIYVTEPFHKSKQVKADAHKEDNIPVLKLNSTKNYVTGIYPYSIMSSSFYPITNNQHAIKVSFSSQEWCGQVYTQLNNREDYEINSHSYFEKEADQIVHLKKEVLENELWNQLRIDPSSLPTGTLQIIPSLEYLRLSHKELKAYTANAILKKGEKISTYEIKYPSLDRRLTINFTSNFPYIIENWTVSSKSGFGKSPKTMTSTATKIKTLKSPYWQKNSNRFLPLRDSLGI